MKSKENALTDKEIEDMFNACKDDKDKLILLVLVYSGLRVSEFAHLRASWVDWQEETINVPAMQNCNKLCCVQRAGSWQPKTKMAVRSVPMKEVRLKEVLRAYFTLNNEVPLTTVAIWYRVKRLAQRANIAHKVYPHALRATAATLFAHKGISAPTLQYIMGWSQLKWAELYVQSSKRRALEEVDKVYGK